MFFLPNELVAPYICSHTKFEKKWKRPQRIYIFLHPFKHASLYPSQLIRMIMMQSYNYANVCKSMLNKTHDLTHYVILRLQLKKLCSYYV
jgi:hypothetical protein